jgi:hypothetical protein
MCLYLYFHSVEKPAMVVGGGPSQLIPSSNYLFHFVHQMQYCHSGGGVTSNDDIYVALFHQLLLWYTFTLHNVTSSATLRTRQ